MLGELLLEEAGVVTSQRVMPVQNGQPQIEISFEANGSGSGVDYQHRATYLATLRPDGTIWGEGNGLIIGTNGDVVTWHGGGYGHMTPSPDGDYTVSYRGAVYYSSTSAGPLGALNGKVGVYEYDVDTSNKTTARVYEWS
jgi:hypothetical protein